MEEHMCDAKKALPLNYGVALCCFVVLTFKRFLHFYWIILISVVRVIAGVTSLEGDSRERLGRKSRKG